MSNVKKNFIYNIMYQILVMILPLITAPYIARILGTEGVGIYSYTYSVAYYFVLFAMLGLNNYGNRQVAKVRDDKDKLSKTFISIYCMQLITSAIMIFCYIIYLRFFIKENLNIAIIQIIYLISTAFDINWFFFGLEKFKLTVTRNTIIKILTVICVFIFVKTRDDLYKYTLIMSIGTLISQLMIWPFVKKSVKFVKISIKDIFKHIKPCLILFIPVIAVSLYKIMDKVMIGNMSTMEQVGLYENSEKIVNILTALITALGTVMLPKISNLLANGEKEKSKQYIEKSMEFTIISSVAFTFGLMAIAKPFAPLFFGEEFKDAGIIIQYLAITTIFVAIANVIRTQYLIPNEKDKTFIISVSLGALVNIVFNLLLIPKYQALGAVIGTILAEFSVMIYQIMDVRKELPVFKYLKDNFKYFVLGIIMFFAVSVLHNLIENDALLVTIQVIIGVLIYATGFGIIQMIDLKEKNIIKLIQKLRVKYNI